jgi:hypothetical protein
VIDTRAANSSPQLLINSPGVEMGDGSPQCHHSAARSKTPASSAAPLDAGNFGQFLISSAIMHLLAVISACDRDRESCGQRRSVPRGYRVSRNWCGDVRRVAGGYRCARSVYGFAVIAASRHPKTFVVPSDPDFTELLNSPTENGIKYRLVVPPTGRGKSDVLNMRYPTLYDTGAEIATLELEIPNDGDKSTDLVAVSRQRPGCFGLDICCGYLTLVAMPSSSWPSPERNSAAGSSFS